MKSFIAPALKRVGIDKNKNLSHLDTLLRAKVVSWACKLGMKQCTDYAKESWKQWMGQEQDFDKGAELVAILCKKCTFYPSTSPKLNIFYQNIVLMSI